MAIGLKIAPMIDMSFLFLIFFLATARFERPEGLFASEMPRDRGEAAVVELPLSPIVIRLARGGADLAGVVISLDNFAARPADFRALAETLRGIHGQPGFDADTPVVIVAAPDVPWEQVVGAWNGALNAGCRRVAFGG